MLQQLMPHHRGSCRDLLHLTAALLAVGSAAADGVQYGQVYTGDVRTQCSLNLCSSQR